MGQACRRRSWRRSDNMKTVEEIAERIRGLQAAKESLLYPLQLVILGGILEWSSPLVERVTPAQAALESLNAEIAALTWVLGNEVVQGEQGWWEACKARNGMCLSPNPGAE